MSDKRIPQSEIDRANQDIVSVIQKYIPLKKAGKNWSAICPFHDERSPSFTVNEAKEMYYCFGCGAGGNAVKFVMDHQGMGFRDAVQAINGSLTLSNDDRATPRKAIVRAVRCELPGHAEDREKTASVISRCDSAEQHIYLMKNNTAPHAACLTLKGSLIVPLINNIGEQVNAAAITSTGITYAAGNPSFGSTAILEPAGDPDGKTIICIDYAHAWRIWWAQGGSSKVLCAMEFANFNWMLSNCRERFTHVGCDPIEADEHVEMGRSIIAIPLDPYARFDRKSA